MEKKPMQKAKEMLNSVKAQIQENESEIQEVDEKVNQAAEELTLLRSKIQNAKSKAEYQLTMETQFSNWLAKCVGLRSEAQDNNDMAISLGYQQRFLKFVAKGEMKPTIVGLMDSQAIVNEMKQATKKNFGLMEKALASMDDGNSELYSEWFNVE
jgi:chromosome segregation ATPase